MLLKIKNSYKNYKRIKNFKMPNRDQPGVTGHNRAQPGMTGHNRGRPGTTGHDRAWPGTTGHNRDQPAQISDSVW